MRALQEYKLALRKRLDDKVHKYLGTRSGRNKDSNHPNVDKNQNRCGSEKSKMGGILLTVGLFN
ncbi:hypothetical protein RRG08_064256, partial [Elysia crispata]